MFEEIQRTVAQAALSLLVEYRLKWSLKDIIDHGPDGCVVKFDRGGDGLLALTVDLHEVTKREGSVTEKGVADEIKKSLQLLGITPPR
jgi:hypothetical protein